MLIAAAYRPRDATFGFRIRAGCRLDVVLPVRVVFLVGWAAFWAYWLVAAFSMKRGRVAWSRELPVRVVIAVVVLVLVRLGVFRHGGGSAAWRSVPGVILFAAGLAFAVWARVHLGRNWGMPMSQKNDPELVTSGPYRFVRHPIYTGILTAGLGTGVALDWTWLIGVALAAAYFGYSAVVEERTMSAQLPDTYPAYRRSTKMIVPFVL
jgi:protein-S-isoprenylcysteine O-methyltransferase Ste14